jgi:hypothetical protein
VRQKTKQEDLIVHYLFGDLTEEEQSQIEEQFLADNQYFEQMRSVEDALIDDYVQGELNEYERRKVEGLLLSSPRQASEIVFVRDLIRSISEKTSVEENEQKSNQVKRSGKLQSLLAILNIRNPWKRFSLAVMLLLAILGLYMIIWNLALQKRIKQMEAKQDALEQRDRELQGQINEQQNDREDIARELESERSKRDQLEQELIALQESRPSISSNNIETIDLNADSVSRGGGELRVVRIHPGVSQLKIRINLAKEDYYKSYSAVIKTFEGREIWSKDQIGDRRANPGRLVLTLSASLFANDDYTLTLKGRTETGAILEIRDYSIRVRR